MPAPPKVLYQTEAEYRRHFERIYCRGPIVTFDGIPVRFRKDDFDHCMYLESPMLRKKVKFSRNRAERIDWIKATLENPHAGVYQGWDRQKKRINPNRRVAVAYEDFIVVIEVWKRPDGSHQGKFITAYPAGEDIKLIRSKPRWCKQ